MNAPALALVSAAAEAPAWWRAIHLTRLDLTLTPAHPWRLPPEPGVTLRGALGDALQRLVCVSPGAPCPACPARSACVVPQWLDPGRLGASAGRPLIPWVDAPGGSWVGPTRPLAVTVWVLGEAPNSDLIVASLVEMARRGLGPERVPHTITRLMAQGAGGPSLLLADGVSVGAWPVSGSLSDHVWLPRRPQGARVHLTHPARWSGARADVPPRPAELISAMIRRARQVAREQGGAVDRYWPAADGLRGLWRDLQWTPGARFSARQGETVPLGGFTGALQLGPEVAPFADLLAAATVLGVGKNTSCGLGRVVVEWREG